MSPSPIQLCYSPSPVKDDDLHAERSFPAHSHSIQLFFLVYFHAVCLLEPQTNTSPSSSSQSGHFIAKSNQDSRGKSFLTVLAKKRARLNCLDYKKERDSRIFFPPLLFLDSTVISAHRSTVFKASMTQDSHVIPRHTPHPVPCLPSATESQIISKALNLASRRDHKRGFR